MLHYLVDKIRKWQRAQNSRESLITIEISKSALLNNLHSLQKLAPTWQLAPVLKSNAYGHGITIVADILQKEDNLPFFCIDSYFEAEQLRRHSTKKTLLILGHTPTSIITKNKLKNIHFTVGSLEQLKELIDKKIKQTVQIKFDTGMHRQGIPNNLLEDAIELFNKNVTLNISGALSHLAEAENPDSQLTQRQITNWNSLVERLQKKFPAILYYHLTNSAGLAYPNKIKANVGRIGLALYGFGAKNLSLALQPVLKMKSLISEIRDVAQDEQIGYDGTFTAPEKLKIATVPVGYFEGIDRRLSNQGTFLINGQHAPLVGIVSMNISSCDVTKIPNAGLNSEVTIISDQPNNKNSVANIAKICQTIPYEILVHFPAHLRRVAVSS